MAILFAAEVMNTPAGTIGSKQDHTVQAAINELDGDVSSLSTVVAVSLKKDVEDQLITGGAGVSVRRASATPAAASTLTVDIRDRSDSVHNKQCCICPDCQPLTPEHRLLTSLPMARRRGAINTSRLLTLSRAPSA